MSRVMACMCVLVAGGVGGCTIPEWETGMPVRYEARETVANANLHVRMLVSGDWLNCNLEKADLVIVHVGRERKTYDTGHVPGAHFVAVEDFCVARNGLPNEMPPSTVLTALVRRLGVGENDQLVVYDDEQGLLAARFYVTMDYVGLGDRTCLLDGQFRRWQADGRPLTRNVPKAGESQFVPAVRPQVIASTDAVRDMTELHKDHAQARTCLVDCRPAGEYAGQSSGEGVKRAGHIPGAVNVPWTSNLRSLDNPVLLDGQELRRLYAQAGVTEGDAVTTYCRSGMQASMGYFVLKYLGYNVSLYDASYWKWSRMDDLPVAQGQE